MVRIGFIGSGLIAWAHGLGLKAMIDGGVIDASVEAVHDQRERRARSFAESMGADVVDDAAAVAARCDAVWVCTPTAAHRHAVDECVAAERAVFCEKPLAVDLPRAASLVEAVESAGVPSQCGLVLRSAPVFRALRGVVASGELGTPMAAVFRDDQYFPIQGRYPSKWRADVCQAGGGCLIEHSIHDVDILRFCFGGVTAVAARTANVAGYDGVEDLASVSVSFASGLEAQLTSVWHAILTRASTRRIEVFFRDGMVWLDDEFRGPLHIQTSAGTAVRRCPSPAWVDALPLADDEVGLAIRAYVEADRGFVDAVAARTIPEPGLEEALVAHRLVDAAYRSAAAGGAPVEIG
jgi:predicted dehydrogenase